MRHWSFLLLGLAVAVGAVGTSAHAQNVTGYDSIANPYLLLLREPAVHTDLDLSDAQRTALQSLNDEVDGPMLSMRNKSSDQATKTMSDLMARSRKGVEAILDADQQQRISQIMLRLRGIKVVTLPKVAERLELNDRQLAAIKGSVAEAAKELKDLKEKLQSGASQQQINRQAGEVRQREYKAVVGELTKQQQTTLAQMLGRRFDPSKLGKTRFKVPDFATGSTWINGKPMTMSGLRGQVVVLHFWAFG